MPLFSFRCNHCGFHFETLVSYSKRDEVVCPQCESKDKERTFKPGAVKGPISKAFNMGSCSSSGFT